MQLSKFEIYRLQVLDILEQQADYTEIKDRINNTVYYDLLFDIQCVENLKPVFATLCEKLILKQTKYKEKIIEHLSECKRVVDGPTEYLDAILEEFQIKNNNSKNNSVTASPSKRNREKNQMRGSFHEAKLSTMLQEFKRKNMKSYRFVVPVQYQMTRNIRLLGEVTDKMSGNLIRIYKSGVVEVVTKAKDRHVIFEDGTLFTYFNDDNRRLVSSDF